MKVRQGFVSNSSSSSFILIGEEIDKHATKDTFERGRRVFVLGEGWECANSCYEVKNFEEWRELINAGTDEELDQLTFVLAAMYASEPWGRALGSGEMPEGLKIWGGEADYYPGNVKGQIEQWERNRSWEDED